MENYEIERLSYLLKLRTVEAEKLLEAGEIDNGGSSQTILLPPNDSPAPPTSTANINSSKSGSNAGNINKNTDISYLPNPTYQEYVEHIPPISVYQKTGKIQLPPNRDADGRIVTGYAQRHIMENNLYSVPNADRFDIYKWESTFPRFTGEGRLRLDFIYYLNELADRVCPKLGVKKLVLTSTFRTIDKQSTISGWSTAKYGPHMGGTAVDISAHGDDRYIIADAAYDMNFGGIAVASGFVHIDIGAYKRWSYDGTPIYYTPMRRKG